MSAFIMARSGASAEGADRQAPVGPPLDHEQPLQHLVGAALFRRRAGTGERAPVSKQRPCVRVEGFFAEHDG
jgi:hypothetical protein